MGTLTSYSTDISLRMSTLGLCPRDVTMKRTPWEPTKVMGAHGPRQWGGGQL